MKNQITSIELHFIAKELQFLINARVDKVLHSEGKEVFIQFYVKNDGRKLLKIVAGKCLHVTTKNPLNLEPSQFCMFLRKYLINSRLIDISQIKPERIIILKFKKAEKLYSFIIEFISKGNIIFCDSNNAIMNALEFADYNTRSISPKIEYTHPKMPYDLFKITIEDFSEMLKSSKLQSIVKSLAVDLGLGGLYAEETLLRAEVNKNKLPSEISLDEIKKILEILNYLLNEKISAIIYLQEEKMVDAVPFSFLYYKDMVKKEFGTFNEALDCFYSQDSLKSHNAHYDKEIEKIKKIIEIQQSTLKKLKNSEIENRHKGDLIYKNFNVIQEILSGIKKESEKSSWKEIKEKLKANKLIKDMDLKDKKIIFDIE